MKIFQDLGHEVIFLIGDFTGQVGDPSGVNETRPVLTEDQLNKNAETYKKQVFKILDPDKTEIRFNSEWMKSVDPSEFIKMLSSYTVARMLKEMISLNDINLNNPSLSMNFYIQFCKVMTQLG